MARRKKKRRSGRGIHLKVSEIAGLGIILNRLDEGTPGSGRTTQFPSTFATNITQAVDFWKANPMELVFAIGFPLIAKGLRKARLAPRVGVKGFSLGL